MERLENEAAGYKEEIERMLESFQQRELELRQEMSHAEQRTQVSTHSVLTQYSLSTLCDPRLVHQVAAGSFLVCVVAIFISRSELFVFLKFLLRNNTSNLLIAQDTLI